jgi:hypothetical protein
MMIIGIVNCGLQQQNVLLQHFQSMVWSKGSCHEIQECKKFLNNTTAPHISTNPSITAVKAELSRS